MNDGRTQQHGTTLVELMIAVAIMATVFTAVLPLFAGIRNSTEARWAALERVQNARVLNEYLCRHLAEAHRVVGVSPATDDHGYIEFETAAGTLWRCSLGHGGDIEFGWAEGGQEGGDAEPSVAPAGVLAGPVEYLRFACYDDNDLAHPVTAPGRIRLVTWEVGWRGSSRMMQSRTAGGACCLRIGVQGGSGQAVATEKDAAQAQGETILPPRGVQDRTAVKGAL
jgi:prepilin-type N-terminal cleavage/methylation domain-containing protein